MKWFGHTQKMLLSFKSFLTSGDRSFYSLFHVGYFYVLHCVRVKECVDVGSFFTDYTCYKDLQVASLVYEMGKASEACMPHLTITHSVVER